MKKQLHFCLICFILFQSLLMAGCSMLYSEKSKDTTTAASELRIMLKMGDAFIADNNVYIEALEQKLNLQLKIEAPSPSSYNERLNVMMAVGDLPDIVQLNWAGEGNFPMWVQNGLIQAIDILKAPNIESNIPKAILATMKVGLDDRIYGVPGITTSYPYGVAIRQDWLDALGLEHPRTLDEYIHVLHLFTEADPDGNSKSDTVGVTSWRLNHIGGIFAGAFQTDYLWNTIHPDVGDSNSVAKLREEQRGYIQFLDFARSLYENHLLDKAFSNLQNAEDKFILGKVGMIGAYSCDMIKLEEQLKKSVPDAKLQWILGPGDHEGRVWNFVPESYGYNGAGSMFGNNSIFLVTKDANENAALFFLDQMNSKEMILFSNLGIQGIHYDLFDSNRNLLIRTPEQNDAVKRDLFGLSDTFRGESHAYLGNNEDENNRLEYYRKKGYLLITNPRSYSMGLVSEMAEFQQTHPNYKEYERSLAIQYVSGDISKEKYIQVIQQELRQQKDMLSSKLHEKYTQLNTTVMNHN